LYLLRYILHDWTDAEALVILRHLRASALPTTRLLIAEKLLPFASRVDSKTGFRERHFPLQRLPCCLIGEPANADLYFYDMTLSFPA
ncbi:hypothetical protein C8R43DRAFT_1189910, partial [Mycena crocata]